MLIDFFLGLKRAGVPVTLYEFLTLLEALEKRLAFGSAEEFYFLARLILVKDEVNYDKFDRVFMEFFQGATLGEGGLFAGIPEEWLRKIKEKFLTEEQKRQIQALGGLDKLLETLKQRLAEQKERHQGGSKWIGTGGTSPFGAYGYHPEGIRIGQPESRHRRAVKVWDRREFRNLDGSAELGTRNMKMALRRVRHFAREGAQEELDLPGTIRATANNAGYLDLRMVPERHNKVKVLLLLDVGGSMDPHVEDCEQLFCAARSEFKHLEHFYFHNCVYEKVWRDNRRRHHHHLPTFDLIHHFGPDWKLILVGDATMGPYEIEWPGGSVEHDNAEAGSVWLSRLLAQYPRAVWLNPVSRREWEFSSSVRIIRRMMGDRMFPLTVDGVGQAVELLNR
ncbi:vWA domain-containing protein [Geomonas subterranea]|uniref:vWA domain-containing protein n=1 Tax=Geomonas subterranea TaxID=2847989 RepID=UPI001CD34C52|nr:VWA domain-containing protein [Geomonas fuzhouensis]